MRILATGGAGFIGSTLVDRLVELGHQVSVIDNCSTGKREYVNAAATLIEGDIQDPDTVARAFSLSEPEAVFHLAAQLDVRKSVADPLFDASTNVMGTLAVLEACVAHKVGYFAFASTGGAVYGEAEVLPTPETAPTNPMSPYAVAKLAVEKYLAVYQGVHGLKSITLRLANIYGPRQDRHGEAGVVAIFAGNILEHKPSTINGTGEQIRDFVYVGDVVDAFVGAFEAQLTGTYNVATGVGTSVNEVFRILTSESGSTTDVSHGPAKAGEQMKSVLDPAALKQAIGWQPKVALSDGLKRTLDWMRSQQ